MLHHFLLHPLRIGGIGKHVELDEMHLVKRKFNLGRLVNACWIFGGYCVEDKTCFLIVVPNRTREVLFPIINEFVCNGSIITTDEAAVYRTLEQDLGLCIKLLTTNDILSIL
jgi:hypothetical protein